MRLAGCTLPVEMFFPEEEFPIKAVEQELQQLGVVCSVLPDLVPAYAIKNSSNLLTDTEGKRLAGFSMKSAAILLSSFEEVRSLLLALLLSFVLVRRSSCQICIMLASQQFSRSALGLLLTLRVAVNVTQQRNNQHPMHCRIGPKVCTLHTIHLELQH